MVRSIYAVCLVVALIASSSCLPRRRDHGGRRLSRQASNIDYASLSAGRISSSLRNRVRTDRPSSSASPSSSRSGSRGGSSGSSARGGSTGYGGGGSNYGYGSYGSSSEGVPLGRGRSTYPYGTSQYTGAHSAQNPYSDRAPPTSTSGSGRQTSRYQSTGYQQPQVNPYQPYSGAGGYGGAGAYGGLPYGGFAANPYAGYGMYGAGMPPQVPYVSPYANPYAMAQGGYYGGYAGGGGYGGAGGGGGYGDVSGRAVLGSAYRDPNARFTSWVHPQTDASGRYTGGSSSYGRGGSRGGSSYGGSSNPYGSSSSQGGYSSPSNPYGSGGSSSSNPYVSSDSQSGYPSSSNPYGSSRSQGGYSSSNPYSSSSDSASTPYGSSSSSPANPYDPSSSQGRYSQSNPYGSSSSSRDRYPQGGSQYGAGSSGAAYGSDSSGGSYGSSTGYGQSAGSSGGAYGYGGSEAGQESARQSADGSYGSRNTLGADYQGLTNPYSQTSGSRYGSTSFGQTGEEQQYGSSDQSSRGYGGAQGSTSESGGRQSARFYTAEQSGNQAGAADYSSATYYSNSGASRLPSSQGAGGQTSRARGRFSNPSTVASQSRGGSSSQSRSYHRGRFYNPQEVGGNSQVSTTTEAGASRILGAVTPSTGRGLAAVPRDRFREQASAQHYGNQEGTFLIPRRRGPEVPEAAGENRTEEEGRPNKLNSALRRCTRLDDGLPDLYIEHARMRTSVFLERKLLKDLSCAMSKDADCLPKSAYLPGATSPRKLLRFNTIAYNNGTADFLPNLPRDEWIFHSCHKHYHSMKEFAHFHLIDVNGTIVGEGHKVSFCLQDSKCRNPCVKSYDCKTTTQGISPGCRDVYEASRDCQWVDVTDVRPGTYTLRVTVNPLVDGMRAVPELSYTNNVSECTVNISVNTAQATRCWMK